MIHFLKGGMHDRQRRSFRSSACSTTATTCNGAITSSNEFAEVPFASRPSQNSERFQLHIRTSSVCQGSFRFERRDYLGVYANLPAFFQGA
jgi:hypothetical protein